MGLFSKKPPCPICGGKISWFLPAKVEGEYICDACYAKVDMDRDIFSRLTLEGLREYLEFYEGNRALKDKFVISERFDFGAFDTKIIVDYQNGLFCMSGSPDKTVFEGRHLKSFTIKEDSAPLFEGSAAGLLRFASTVPNRAMAMAPHISRFIMKKEMARALDKLDDGKQNRSVPPPMHFDVPEPFKAFNVELHVDHPYWSVIRCDMGGPRFDNNHPDVNNYLSDYQSRVEVLERLAAALKSLAFPGAPDKYIGFGAETAVHTSPASTASTDPVEEIRKYKALLDEGIITELEFAAKKRMLLHI